MRALIRCFDGLIRQANSIFEFFDAEDCLLLERLLSEGRFPQDIARQLD